MKLNKKTVLSVLLAFALVIGVLAGGIGYHNMRIEASFDPDECITFGSYAASTEIPEATLWIGTYLMNMSAVRQDADLITTAEETADASGQSDWYYKSELTSDSWYMVSETESLSDITSTEQSVSLTSLSSLYVKYYVDSNGTIYDLYTGAADVNPYEDPNPYDKWYMDEYADVADLIYEGYLSQDTSDQTLAFYYDLVETHMNYMNTDDYTDARDTEIASLWSLRTALEDTQDADDSNYADALTDILDSVDADRMHHYIQNILSESGVTAMTDFMDEADNPWSVSNLKTADEDSATAVDTAYSALKESLETLSEEIISDPGTSGALIDREKYKCYEEIVAYDGTQGANDEIRSALKRYLCLLDLESGDILYQEDELALAEELLPQAIANYETKIAAGVSPQYQTAIDQDAEMAGLVAILDSQQSDAIAAQYEIRTLIDAKRIRMESDAAAIFIAEKIVEANSMYDMIVPDDAYTDYAYANVANYIEWLYEELSKCVNEADNGDTDADDADIEDQIECYESLQEQADLENDMATSENLQLLIDALTSQLSESGAGTGSDNADGDSADAASGASDTANAAKEAVLSSIRDQAAEDIVNGLSQSGSVVTLVVIEDEEGLSDLLSDYGLSHMVDALAYASEISNAANGTSSSYAGSSSSDNGSDTDAFMTDLLDSNMSDADSSNLSSLASALGTDADSLDDSDKLAILAAANDSNTGDSSSAGDTDGSSDDSDSSGSGSGDVSLSKNLKSQLLLELLGSGLLYDAYTSDDQIFVSLKAIETAVDGRYVFDYAKQQANLQLMQDGKTSTYIFTAGYSIVTGTDGTLIIVDDDAVVYSNWLYISQYSSQLLYGVTGVWIDDRYMAALNEEAYEKYLKLMGTEE